MHDRKGHPRYAQLQIMTADSRSTVQAIWLTCLQAMQRTSLSAPFWDENESALAENFLELRARPFSTRFSPLVAVMRTMRRTDNETRSAQSGTVSIYRNAAKIMSARLHVRDAEGKQAKGEEDR